MELLITVLQPDYNDRKRYCSTYRRGDVIDYVPDGWAWSEIEMTKPEWRILKMPTLTEVEAQALMQPEENPDDVKPYTWTLRRRGLYFEKVELPYKFMRYLRDYSRQLPWYEVGQAGEDQIIRDIIEDKGDADTYTPIFQGGPINDVDLVVDVNTAFDMDYFFLGSQRPFTFSVTNNTLPPGLGLNPATGVISGTPNTIGSYANNRMRGTDADSNVADSGLFRVRVMTQEQYDELYP